MPREAEIPDTQMQEVGLVQKWIESLEQAQRLGEKDLAQSELHQMLKIQLFECLSILETSSQENFSGSLEEVATVLKLLQHVVTSLPSVLHEGNLAYIQPILLVTFPLLSHPDRNIRDEALQTVLSLLWISTNHNATAVSGIFLDILDLIQDLCSSFEIVSRSTVRISCMHRLLKSGQASPEEPKLKELLQILRLHMHKSGLLVAAENQMEEAESCLVISFTQEESAYNCTYAMVFLIKHMLERFARYFPHQSGTIVEIFSQNLAWFTQEDIFWQQAHIISETLSALVFVFKNQPVEPKLRLLVANPLLASIHMYLINNPEPSSENSDALGEVLSEAINVLLCEWPQITRAFQDRMIDFAFIPTPVSRQTLIIIPRILQCISESIQKGPYSLERVYGAVSHLLPIIRDLPQDSRDILAVLCQSIVNAEADIQKLQPDLCYLVDKNPSKKQKTDKDSISVRHASSQMLKIIIQQVIKDDPRFQGIDDISAILPSVTISLSQYHQKGLLCESDVHSFLSESSINIQIEQFTLERAERLLSSFNSSFEKATSITPSWLVGLACLLVSKILESSAVIDACSGKESFLQPLERCIKFICANLNSKKWRSQIFRTGANKIVTTWLPAFLRSLPWITSDLDQEEREVFDFTDYLRFLISKDPQLASIIAKVLGPLCCSLSRTATFSNQVGKDGRIESILSCDVCKSQSPKSTQNSGSQNVNIPYLAKLCLQLTEGDQTTQTRVHSIESFGQIIHHLKPLDETEFASCFSKLAQMTADPDAEVLAASFSTTIEMISVSEQDGRVDENARVSFFENIQTSIRALSRTNTSRVLLRTYRKALERLKDFERASHLIFMISFLHHANIDVTAEAYTNIKFIAQSMKLSIPDMCLRYQREICEFLITKLISHPRLVSDAVSALYESDMKTFLKIYARSLLPHVMKLGSRELLDEMAKRVGDQSATFLFNNIQNVLPDLFLDAGNDFEDSKKFIEEIMGEKLGKILGMCLPEVLNGVTMELGKSEESKKKAIIALKKICEFVHEGASTPLSDFLRKPFLGIVDFFNKSHLTKQARKDQKIVACRSFGSLVMLLESNVKYVRPKVMTTLKSLLEDRDLEQEALQIWESFLSLLDISSTKQIIGQVVAELIPYLDSSTDHVVRILENLILNNKEALQQQLGTIHFIPNHPALQNITHMLALSRGNENHKDKLVRFTSAISHESPVVKEQVLSELLDFLQENQSTVCDIIVEELRNPSFIGDILKSLSICLREHKPKVQLKAAQCLGSLGAIDPSQVEVTLRTKIPWHDCDESFASELIMMHLVRILRTEQNASWQDLASLSIQEILKFFGCDVTTPLKSENAHADDQAAKLWFSFPKEVQEIIHPFLSSKYVPINQAPTSVEGPFFHPSKPFRKWLAEWSSNLILRAVDSRGRIISFCRGVIRIDNQTAIYLLPYLIQNIISFGSDNDRAAVLQEMIVILKSGTFLQSNEDSVQNLNTSNIQLAIQTIFIIVDRLGEWVEYVSGSTGSEPTPQCQYVQTFLDNLPQQLMADASFHCGAFARSLKHYENFVRNELEESSPTLNISRKATLQKHASQLQRIYHSIGEQDALAGVASLQNRPSLSEQILYHESNRRWTDALTCYELALQREPKNPLNHIGLLNCQLNLGHLQTMIAHVNGTLMDKPELKKDLLPLATQAAWKLGQWDVVDNYTKTCPKTFDSNFGRILISLNKQPPDTIQSLFTDCYQDLVEPLSAASMISYPSMYEYVVKLHILNETQEFAKRLQSTSSTSLSTILTEWNRRLLYTQPNYQVREAILRSRLALLSIANQDEGLSTYWIKIAKAARKAGNYQTASSACMTASILGSQVSSFEKAKLHWSQNLTHAAVNELESSIQEFQSSLETLRNPNSRKEVEEILAKSLLLLARWNQNTGQKKSEEIMMTLRKASDLKKWEKGFFHYAKFAETILQAQKKKAQDSGDQGKYVGAKYPKVYQMLPIVLENYGNALLHGHHYLPESLPRFLTLYFEFGITSIESKEKDKVKKSFCDNIHSIFERIVTDLPTYKWLFALPQLISRVCHRNPDVYQKLERLLVDLVMKFPQQTLWSLAVIMKSSVKMRVKKADAILYEVKGSRTATADMKLIIDQFSRLSDQFINLCNYEIKDNRHVLSIQRDFRPLERMMPVQVIVPTQSALTPSLPTIETPADSHNPFPRTQATIKGFRDEVELLFSLQKPRKVTIVGNDGRLYIFLCKPNDDLRKDNRMMEVFTTVNNLLKKNPESRRTNLQIMTYAVVPLNEEVGLIEWIPGLVGLRQVLQKIYRIKSKGMSNKEIKEVYSRTDLDDYTRFKQHVMPSFPSVFYEWFLSSFPEPTSWFNAKLIYARSCAVMSMVGTVVGLGDRHGENVNFDSRTGMCVHVDFNCLFSKGLTFNKPEVVPFRLTHNMVDAMGLTGYEGVFRKSSEVVMRLLRENRDSLMSILETFVYDPLVEWTKGSQLSTQTGEQENTDALKMIAKIDQVLHGVIGDAIPLSVEGHVQHLIEQSTSDKLLSQMYVGWGAYY
eukprot:TRINITY_DN4030_c0_g1_i1.p1 TRINITY_DN4030_c0_g1~~TRINITY_DN4030_c0_g1_i1.p1  ORF type:complete len:2534 (-),score=449.32 TRINITY_DN4030_c0_g1_i1:366-7967(-)